MALKDAGLHRELEALLPDMFDLPAHAGEVCLPDFNDLLAHFNQLRFGLVQESVAGILYGRSLAQVADEFEVTYCPSQTQHLQGEFT